MLPISGFSPVAYQPFPNFFGAGQPAAPQAAFGPAAWLPMLQEMLMQLSSLAQGWGGLMGNPQPQPQFVTNYNPGFPQVGFGNPISSTGGGLYGGGGLAPAPVAPTDAQEFASYLQAQRIGGTLEGKTGIAQSDAIPGSRFGTVVESEAWQASVARNYAYQFSAFAIGANALTPEGVQAGQQAFTQMRPEAQLFTQVAAVFKGNLLDGPGFYDNPGLKQLLQSKGLTHLANQEGVGQTDVQSIGAITQALNTGQITLDEVIASGTIDNLDRYFNIINYVQSGGFNQALSRYETE